jgi:hypothetical protein
MEFLVFDTPDHRVEDSGMSGHMIRVLAKPFKASCVYKPVEVGIPDFERSHFIHSCRPQLVLWGIAYARKLFWHAILLVLCPSVCSIVRTHESDITISREAVSSQLRPAGLGRVFAGD